MSLRESLNRKPAIAAGVAAVAVAVAVAFGALSSRGSPARGPGDAYFSTDDGKTWFDDSAEKIAPFPHKGADAVRAYVFECDGRKFVNHLERSTPERRQRIEQIHNTKPAANVAPGMPPPGTRPPSKPASSLPQTVNVGLEFKKPGSPDWIPGPDLARSSKVTNATCPDGKPATPVQP